MDSGPAPSARPGMTREDYVARRAKARNRALHTAPQSIELNFLTCLDALGAT